MIKRNIGVKLNVNRNPLKPSAVYPFAILGEPRHGFCVMAYECTLLTTQEMIAAFENAIKELKEM